MSICLPKSILFSLAACLAILVEPRAAAANACRYMPLEWQREVREHSNPVFVGQRKHKGWIRDQDSTFIDDEIEKRFSPGESVDIIVNFNTCLPPGQIHNMLDGFGRIIHIGKFIPSAMLQNVSFDDLPAIAALPRVAMVEWQVPLRPMLDASTRAVQSKESTFYFGQSAEDAGFFGSNVVAAIVDTGINNEHPAFANKFVAGFDATIFEDFDHDGANDLDNDETGDGSNDPEDGDGHGTHVAGILLGAEVTGLAADCGVVAGDFTLKTCEGVAPAARFVDVQACIPVPGSQAVCPVADVTDAFEWIGINAKTFNIRVVNASLGSCVADDGTSQRAQLVNYLTAALGLTVVVAHGNADLCDLPPGTQLTGAPGSASYAITVSGSNDRNTVDRGDDTIWGNYLTGPRGDFDTAENPDLLALKPDLAAPGQAVISADYDSFTGGGYTSLSGTSMAAPHVAGAAAVLLQARPDMGPGSIKHVLKETADKTHNTAEYPLGDDPDWDEAFGSGLLNVWAALDAEVTGDVRFPSCVGPSAGGPNAPCELDPPHEFWDNQVDIATESPIVEGGPNQIVARVRNDGSEPATVLVNFGVHEFGTPMMFHPIGTQKVTIPSESTVDVEQPWVPEFSDHQCIQVEIDYGFDENYTNNVTQRNFMIEASVFDMRVENPFMTRGQFEIEAASDRDGWRCEVNEAAFKLEPFLESFKELQITFDAPEGARPGERANCEVAVYGTPEGSEERRLVGGVTVQTFVPEPCRVIGTVTASEGEPVSGAQLSFVRSGRSASAEPVYVTTDEDGVFSTRLTPHLGHQLTVQTAEGGRGEAMIRPECGVGSLRLVMDDGKLDVVH